MGGLSVFLVILHGVVSLGHDGISGSTLEVTVEPGDNITLYCDCKLLTGVYIMWYRNCSHENQPPLVLEVTFNGLGQSLVDRAFLNFHSRFHFVKNQSSGSYDLLIENITKSDEGLYYCGTKEIKVQEDEKITATTVYRYSNMTTRVHCAVCCSHDCVSASVLEVIVRPGDNATLYCDCKISSGVYIAWYRICSHENQPPLVLKPKRGMILDADNSDLLTILNHFQFVRNFSSKSYDLLIHNITSSEEGIYFCGTGERRVEDKDGYIIPRDVFSHSNTTARVILRKHSDDGVSSVEVPLMSSWMLPIIPVITVLSSLISFILVYLFCRKAESQRAKISPETRMISSQNQDEDVCWTRVVFLPQDAKTNQ